MANTVVGVDIGSSTLRAVELQDASKSRPTIVRFGEIALPPGSVRGGEVLEPHTVASALKRLWSTSGFRSRNVILGMGNQRVLVRDLSVPRMSAERIRESLPFLVQDMLPVPVVDAVLDFYPVAETDGEQGPMVAGLLVAAVKDAVMANVKAVQLAGLNPVEVDLLPFALSRALGSGARGVGVVAIVDVGAATTNVLITIDGVPQFARIIPAGGDDLTQALAARLDISADDAERYKRTLGLASGKVPDQHRVAVETIYEVTSELLASLRNTIGYFVNQRGLAGVGRIVLSGGGAQLPGFARALSELTVTPVVSGDPFEGIAQARTARPSKGSAEPSAPHNIAVALGLALGSAS
jgi:type IV pilus assembly protein PilM